MSEQIPAGQDSPHREHRIDTRAIHVPRPDVTGLRPLSMPIFQTSGFAFDDPDAFTDSLNQPDGGFGYSRISNPTVRALENAIADLEGGVGAVATPSGMGAVNTVLFGSLRTGDHAVMQTQLYGGTSSSFRHLAERFGVETTGIVGDDIDEVRAALRPNTKLVYVETITNPSTRVCDLPAIVDVAHERGAIVVVDNTFATPALFRPLEHGADIVLHSTTKYFGGHSDVTGGVIVFADDARYRSVWNTGQELGSTPDPFASWLTLRGLHTLPLRMRQHCANAATIAERLAAHPAISAVHWPGIATHPDHTTALKLLPDGYGSTFSFDIAAGREAALRFVSSLRLAVMAPSLGGVESLALHPASTSHRQLDDAELAAGGITQGTIRLAVGLEHPDDLWSDIAQALSRATD
jgi:methionine-gamma-lyase